MKFESDYHDTRAKLINFSYRKMSNQPVTPNE